MHFAHVARLAAVTAFLVLAASSAGARPPPLPYSFMGWTGTINDVYERHHAYEQTRIDIKAARATQIEANGSVVVTGGYRGTRTETQMGGLGCIVGGSLFFTPLITTETTEGTLDLRQRNYGISGVFVSHQAFSGGRRGISVQQKGMYFTVTETTTRTSPTCPTFVPTTSRQTREGVSAGGLYIEEQALADPAVPHLVGSRTATDPERGETQTKKWDLKGCGEEPGRPWVNRFPDDNNLDALKEPFRTKARRFVAALKEAGARVKVISVYRPPARVYLMHHAWRVAYGRDKPGYTHEEPFKVPAYKGDDNEKVPICWTVRPRINDHDYNREQSIAMARVMVEGYGILVAHGAAYPSNHSSRLAIDMNILWTGVLRVKHGDGGPYRSPVVEISADDYYWIDKDTGRVKYYGKNVAPSGAKLRGDQDMNRALWKLGREYGVLKYVNAATPDPPHWSATGG